MRSESSKMTSSRLYVCMFMTKLSETDSFRALCHLLGHVLTAWHHAAHLPFTREHFNWHWQPVLFTDESRFILRPFYRCERV